MKKKLLLGFCLIICVFPTSLLAQKIKSNNRENKTLQSSIVPRGKNFTFYLTKGGRLLETGAYSEAISYLDAALKSPKKGIKAPIIKLADTLYKTALIYQEAKILRDSGKAEQAVGKYLEIMKINPVDPKPLEFILEIYDILSEAAEKQGNYEEAVRLYENWSNFAPQNNFPRQGILKNLKLAAELAQKNGDEAKVIAFYSKLSLLEPENKQYQLIIQQIEREQNIKNALVTLQQKDINFAITTINSSLSLYPNEPRLIEALRLAQGQREFEQAEALMKSYKYNEALRFYKNTLNFLPEKKDYVTQRSREIFLRTGADYQSNGSLQIRGTITNVTKIQITGDLYKVLQGESNSNIKITGKLPPRPFDSKIIRLEGDLTAKVVERPNIGNKYSLTLELTPKKEKNFLISLDWDLLNTGIITWNAVVNKSATIRLQTFFVDQSPTAKNVVVSYDPLPHEPYTLSINKNKGSEKVSIKIIEQPTLANNYATSVEVSTNAQEAEEITLHMEWLLVRSTKSK